MFLLKKFAKKKDLEKEVESPLNNNNDKQGEEKQRSTQRVQLPIKKSLFPSIYRQSIKISDVYQEGMRVLKQMQDMIDGSIKNTNKHSQEKVSKLWKDVDRVITQLEGCQLCNQIKILFYQHIYKTLQMNPKSAVEFVEDELSQYDEDRYSLILFFIEWQSELYQLFVDECSISISKGLAFLKSQLETIKTSFEIACFLNCYYSDILNNLGDQANQQNQQKEVSFSSKIIETSTQEQICLGILDMILFMYNFQMYVPYQLVQKNIPQLLQKKESPNAALDQQHTMCGEDQIFQFGSKIDSFLMQSEPQQPLHEQQQQPQHQQPRQNETTKNGLNSNKKNNNYRRFSFESFPYQKSLSTEDDQNLFMKEKQPSLPFQGSSQLTKSFSQIQQPLNTVYPLQYTLWQEYDIIKGFKNYNKIVQVLIRLVIDFSFKQQSNDKSNNFFNKSVSSTKSSSSSSSSSSLSSNSETLNDIQKAQILLKGYFYLEEKEQIDSLNLILSLIGNLNITQEQHNKFKHFSQLTLYFLTCEEVDNSHKILLLENTKLKSIINYFVQNDQMKLVYQQNENDFVSMYYPLLNFQSCVVKNGKTSKIHINPRSKFIFFIDVFEQFSIINLSIGIANKDIKLSIKYQGPFQTDNTNNKDQTYPVELVNTDKILIDQSPYRINFIGQQEGIYSIEFINSYSWFASKEVEYRVNILTPYLEEYSKSRQKINSIFPVASKPFHQKAVEDFQRNYESFNETSDQALIIVEQNSLRILYRTKSDKKENVQQIYQSEDNEDIFSILEPQIMSSLNQIIVQRYFQDAKLHFGSISKNKLSLFIVIEDESMREYFDSDSLFSLIFFHSFPSSQIFIESYPNIFIQIFLMQILEFKDQFLSFKIIIFRQKQVISKSRITLYWQYNKSLYKSNNYESSIQVENNNDEVNKISYSMLTENQVLVLRNNSHNNDFMGLNIINGLNLKERYATHSFNFKIDFLFK